MAEKHLYLALDSITILFPFLLSFYSKDKFYRKWKFLWMAILLPGLLFIGWDMLFTYWGVWGFNPRYVIGVNFFNLPIEEVFFFVCIPYACCFTYDVANRIRFKIKNATVIEYLVTDLLGGSLILIGALNYERLHTTVTFLLAGILLLLLRWVFKVTFLGKFYWAFVFFAFPFLMINGILSGTGITEPVVWYNNSEILGIKIGTIPVEDIIYGMTLILLNVAVLEVGIQKSEFRRVKILEGDLPH